MRLIDGGWIEVFRAGRHVDSGGHERVWTRDDLDRIVANHANDGHEPPLVIGHPKTDDPAYGWVPAVRRNGDVLEAQVRNVEPGFAALVEQGRYRTRSVSLAPLGDQGYRVRHVGLLGAKAPSVKGLSDKVAAYHAVDTDAVVLEVPIEHAADDDATLLQGLRALLARMLPGGEGHKDPEPVSVQHDGGTEMAEQQQQSITIEAAVRAAEERVRAEFAASQAEAQAQIAQLQAANRRAQIQSRLAALKRQGRVTPAMERAGLLEFCEGLAALGDTPTLTYSDSEGRAATSGLGQWFDGFMASLPVQIELDKRIVDPDDHTGRQASAFATLDARAKELVQSSNGTVTYSAALAQVGQEEPTLYAEYQREQRARTQAR